VGEAEKRLIWKLSALVDSKSSVQRLVDIPDVAVALVPPICDNTSKPWQGLTRALCQLLDLAEMGVALECEHY